MTYNEFVLKLIEMQAEMSAALFNQDYPEIERMSIRIGKFIHRFLSSQKLYVKK